MDKQRLQLAVEHHQAGRLQEAHELYGEILEADPNETNALRYLGLLAFQLGHPYQASTSSNERTPRRRPTRNRSIRSAWRMPRLSAFVRPSARSVKALGLKADYADAHGISPPRYSRRQLRKPKTAIAALWRSTRVQQKRTQPREPPGRTAPIERAPAAFRAGHALRPDYVEAHNNLGNALAGSRLEEAERALCCTRIAITPGLRACAPHLGNLLRAQAGGADSEHSSAPP